MAPKKVALKEVQSRHHSSRHMIVDMHHYIRANVATSKPRVESSLVGTRICLEAGIARVQSRIIYPGQASTNNSSCSERFKQVSRSGSIMLDNSAIVMQMFKLASEGSGWHVAVLILAVGIWIVVKQLTVPKQLAHLPSVPILPLLWSYAKAEAENERIERLILPFANQKGEGVVVVYALGRWIIHVLDWKARTLLT